MTYSIEILRSAQKDLARINEPDRKKLINSILLLSSDPRPNGCKKLSGRSAWRIRVGDYRVIYEIQDNKLMILVVAIGHRKNIYR
jgi:mRNA interferase RelE/StbE